MKKLGLLVLLLLSPELGAEIKCTGSPCADSSGAGFSSPVTTDPVSATGVWTFDNAANTPLTAADGVIDSTLTATRCTFAGTAGRLSGDADCTFATDTLTATKLVTSSLGSVGDGPMAVTGPYEEVGYHTKELVNTVATGFVTITVPNLGAVGGELEYHTFCTDGVDVQATSGFFTFTGVNKGGTVTSTLSVTNPTAKALSSAATLTSVLTVTNAANSFTILMNSSSSLTPTSTLIRWHFRITSATGVAVVTPL